MAGVNIWMCQSPRASASPATLQGLLLSMQTPASPSQAGKEWLEAECTVGGKGPSTFTQIHLPASLRKFSIPSGSSKVLSGPKLHASCRVALRENEKG